jgi:hypothetical protein
MERNRVEIQEQCLCASGKIRKINGIVTRTTFNSAELWWCFRHSQPVSSCEAERARNIIKRAKQETTRHAYLDRVLNETSITEHATPNDEEIIKVMRQQEERE